MGGLAVKSSSNRMSDELIALYDRHRLITEENDLAELYDMVINDPSYVTDKERNEEAIMLFYEKARAESEDGLPTFMDILSHIFNYNEEIFYKIATLQLVDDLSSSKIDEDDADIEELLEDEAVAVSEWFAYNQGYVSLDDAVFDILIDHKVSFTISEDSTQFECQMGASKIADDLYDNGKAYHFVVNDCQTVLFPQFLENEFSSQSNFILYRPGVWQYV